MAKLVMLITTHVEKGLAVAEAWEAAGAPGVTLIDSYGLHDLRERSRSLEIPLFVSMARLMRQIEQTNQTILAVVDDNLVDALIDKACQVMGIDNLDEERSGVAFVLPVDRIIGIRPDRENSAE